MPTRSEPGIYTDTPFRGSSVGGDARKRTPPAASRGAGCGSGRGTEQGRLLPRRARERRRGLCVRPPRASPLSSCSPVTAPPGLTGPPLGGRGPDAASRRGPVATLPGPRRGPRAASPFPPQVPPSGGGTTGRLAPGDTVILLHFGGKDAQEKAPKCNGHAECQKGTENNCPGHKIRSVKTI